jgi:hypothetical protein
MTKDFGHVAQCHTRVEEHDGTTAVLKCALTSKKSSSCGGKRAMDEVKHLPAVFRRPGVHAAAAPHDGAHTFRGWVESVSGSTAAQSFGGRRFASASELSRLADPIRRGRARGRILQHRPVAAQS